MSTPPAWSSAAAPQLVLVHNHRFERILPRLDELYGRFGTPLHLVPFYQGTRENVVPVYGSSFHFPGFFAQALPRLRQLPASHYIFAGDDLVLHPRLGPENLLRELRLDAQTGFIKFLEPISETRFRWPHATSALLALAAERGVEWSRNLPTREEAVSGFARHGLHLRPLGEHQFARGASPRAWLEFLLYAGWRVRKGARTWRAVQEVPYPLAAGYADLVIVPASALEAFCHNAGVLSAAGVFAELSAPTALALACAKVQTLAGLPWHGLELWSKERERFASAHEHQLAQLFSRFPADRLYVHPIKLSQWH